MRGATVVMHRFLLVSAACVSLCLLCGCRKSSAPQPEHTAKEVRTVDPLTAPLVAGKHSKVFHARGCPYAASAKAPVGFASVQEAEASGRIPCQFCSPRSAGTPPPGGAPGQDAGGP